MKGFQWLSCSVYRDAVSVASSFLLRPRRQASPKLALVSRVHGGVRFASKVLGEFAGVGDGADHSEPGRAVGICDDAFVGALWRPHRAPDLRMERNWSIKWQEPLRWHHFPHF